MRMTRARVKQIQTAEAALLTVGHLGTAEDLCLLLPLSEERERVLALIREALEPAIALRDRYAVEDATSDERVAIILRGGS